MFYKEDHFQETKFGKIPEDWQALPLIKSVGDNNELVVAGPFGSNLKVVDYREQGVPILRLQNIERCRFLNKDIKYVSQEKAEELKYHSFSEGDIVLAKLGMPIGKTCLVPPILEKGIVVADVVRIRIGDGNKLDRNYAVQALNSKFVSSQLNRETIGTTRPRVNLSQVRNLVVPFPKFPEQRQIANVLGVVDSAIELADRVIAKTERLKKGLMQKLLTHGIGHTEHKQTPIGKIPKNWNFARLGDVSSIKTGPFGSQLVKRDLSSYGIKIYEQENVLHNDFARGSFFISAEKFKTLRNFQLLPGDVLLTRVGSLGNAIVAPTEIEPGIIGSRLLRIRADQNVLHPSYLASAIESPMLQRQLQQNAHGATRKGLNSSIVKRLAISLPPLAEQQKINEILLIVNKQIELGKVEKATLQRVKQGSMALLLTGKVRIKVD